jgi:hypothetical protein
VGEKEGYVRRERREVRRKGEDSCCGKAAPAGYRGLNAHGRFIRNTYNNVGERINPTAGPVVWSSLQTTL